MKRITTEDVLAWLWIASVISIYKHEGIGDYGIRVAITLPICILINFIWGKLFGRTNA